MQEELFSSCKALGAISFIREAVADDEIYYHFSSV